MITVKREVRKQLGWQEEQKRWWEGRQ